MFTNKIKDDLIRIISVKLGLNPARSLEDVFEAFALKLMMESQLSKKIILGTFWSGELN